jgi:hypothetical protein
MTSTIQRKIFADRWYRFDRYEIKGGYICPARGATLTPYEPWDNFLSLSGKAAIKQPYEPLLQLAQQIELDYSAPWPGRLKDDGEEKVLGWCSRYGLLGTLLHRVETVVLAPKPQVTSISESPSRPRHTCTRFVRTNPGWLVEGIVPGYRSKTTPGVFLRSSLSDLHLNFERLSETWGSYFPEVPSDERDSYQYPVPFTTDFWKQYAEPLASFVAAAKMLREAVDGIRLVSGRSNLSKEQMRAVVNGDAAINALASPARPLFYHAGKGYGFGWACHSLLATFSMMVMLDLSSARVLECANRTCRRLFVTKTAQAKYCSPTCRGTVQVRKNRRRKARGAQRQDRSRPLPR